MIPVEKCKSLIRSVSCLGRTVLPSLSGRCSCREASPVSAHLQVDIVSHGQDKRIDDIHENKEKNMMLIMIIIIMMVFMMIDDS